MNRVMIHSSKNKMEEEMLTDISEVETAEYLENTSFMNNQ
jgi:hypothetical protein